MYTLNIENIYDKNIIDDSKGDSEITGGGQRFKVYKVTDFITINVEENTSMEKLCYYFFAYIVYDKLIDKDGKPMYDKLQQKYHEIETIIIKQLSKYNVGTTNAMSGDINIFSGYISTLFSVTSGNIDDSSYNKDNFRQIKLSQGQYLHHLDQIYKKYEKIYNIETMKQILDQIDSTYLQKSQSSFHNKIENKYKELNNIKGANFFYKTKDFYIQDENMLDTIFIKNQYSSRDYFEKELKDHGIEHLIHIYYTYISLTDEKLSLYNFKINIRKRIAEFICYNNFDIVNLLIFQDILFYKILNETDTNNSIREDILKHQLFYSYKELEKELRRYYLPKFYIILNSGYNESIIELYRAIDIIIIRQTVLKNEFLLEKESDITEKMAKVTTFYKVGQVVKCNVIKDLENSNSGDSLDNFFIGKIETVSQETKTCSIILLAHIKDNRISTAEEKKKLAYNNIFEEESKIKDSIFDNTIHYLRFKQPESLKDESIPSFSDLFDTVENTTSPATVPFDLIYDTNVLLGVKEQSEQPQIKYIDIDLFDDKFDNSITNGTELYPLQENNVLFIQPESVKTLKVQIQPTNNIGSPVVSSSSIEVIDINNNRKYVYIIFDVSNHIQELKLDNVVNCNYITEYEIKNLFNNNNKLTDTYHINATQCILIERIVDNNIENIDIDIGVRVGNDEKLNKLYFSTNDIVIGVNTQ